MRAFIGVDLPDEIKEKIYELQDKLRPFAEKGRWTSRYNYHLNLKFLGEISEEKLNQVSVLLDEVSGELGAIELYINALGAYGLDARLGAKGMCATKDLWLGVHGEVEMLRTLQHKIEMKLARLGFPAELRGHSPRITLGENMVFDCDFRKIRKEASVINTKIIVEKFHIFKSDHSGLRRIYTPLTTHELKGS